MSKSHFPHEIAFDGLAPADAFAVLGNETRFAIIQALWDAGAHHEYDDLDASLTSIPFSELQRAVGLTDNGKFNYHLSKLIPHFVRQTDEGYCLSVSGRQIARAVVAISGERLALGTGDLHTSCPLCDGSLTATYEDQWLQITCSSCPGEFGDAVPDGAIYHAPFPPSGLTDRTPDEAYSTGIFRCMLDLTYLTRGICRECAGAVDATVEICEDHQPEAATPCQECGTFFSSWADLRCGTCRFAKRLPVQLCVFGFTPVISHLFEQGVDILTPSLDEFDAIESHIRTDIETDPLRVTVSLPDELGVTVDEKLTLVDIEH